MIVLVLILVTVSANRVHVRVQLQPLSASIVNSYIGTAAINAFDDNINTYCHSFGDYPTHWVQAIYPDVICPNKIEIINGKTNNYGTVVSHIYAYDRAKTLRFILLIRRKSTEFENESNV